MFSVYPRAAVTARISAKWSLLSLEPLSPITLDSNPDHECNCDNHWEPKIVMSGQFRTLALSFELSRLVIFLIERKLIIRSRSYIKFWATQFCLFWLFIGLICQLWVLRACLTLSVTHAIILWLDTLLAGANRWILFSFSVSEHEQ